MTLDGVRHTFYCRDVEWDKSSWGIGNKDCIVLDVNKNLSWDEVFGEVFVGLVGLECVHTFNFNLCICGLDFAFVKSNLQLSLFLREKIDLMLFPILKLFLLFRLVICFRPQSC